MKIIILTFWISTSVNWEVGASSSLGKAFCHSVILFSSTFWNWSPNKKRLHCTVNTQQRVILHGCGCLISLSTSSLSNSLGSLSFPFTWLAHGIHSKSIMKSQMSTNNSHLNISFRILDDMALSDGNHFTNNKKELWKKFFNILRFRF